MADQTKLLSWNDDRTEALAAWVERGRALGIDMTAPRFGGKRVHSDAAAIGEALKRAAACKCGCADVTIPAGSVVVHRVPVVVGASPDPNPLRAIREAAGLSQSRMADRCDMTRGAWANAEKAARATEAMVERARKAVGK